MEKWPLVRRHHNMIAATKPPINGPIDKGGNGGGRGGGRGNGGGGTTAGGGKGRPKGGGLLTPAEPDFYRTALLVDAAGQSDGTGYTTDESRHAHALTYNGNAQITSGQFEFDGTGDYIDLAHSILWTPGSKFTIEILGLEFDSVNTGTPQVVVSQDVFNDYSWGISEQSGDLVFALSTSGTATTTSFTIGSVSASTSYNVAVVWDGTTIYSLLNGVQGGSASFSGNFHDSGGALRLGARTYAPADRFLNGRFTSFLLTRGETLYASTGSYSAPALPRAINTPSLTDSNWGDVISLFSYDEDLTRTRDFGPLDLPILNIDVTGSTTVEPFADANSMVFNGTSALLSVVDDALLEFGSGNYTIEAFARFDSLTAGGTIASKQTENTNDRSWWFAQNTGVNQLFLFGSADGSTSGGSVLGASPSGMSADTWYHIAGCRSGNNRRIFIGGTQSGSTQTNVYDIYDGDAPLRVGAKRGTLLERYMDGYLSEVRITKAARYTGSFTAPSAPFPRG